MSSQSEQKLNASAQVLLRTSGYLDTRLLAPNEWILLPDKLKF